MILQSLLLRNFRNYQEIKIECHPSINLIYGDNAQGKTNLLEAIAYLSLAFSFRGQKEENIKGWEQDFFYLGADFTKQDQEHTLSAAYQNKKKYWKKDGNPCKKISEIAGFLHTVVFTPEDLEIVKKGPEVRRHFLDREMIQLFPGYHTYLSNYKRAISQRNNLLRQFSYQKQNDLAYIGEMLEPWDRELAKNGAVIISRRMDILSNLNSIGGKLHNYLSNSQEKFKLVYQGALNHERLNQIFKLNQEEKLKTLEQELFQTYHASHEQDLKKQMTTQGPHRDDFKISLNQVDLRSFGSQGQQRTAALALKLSEVELVHQLKGYYPILLLDDVLSELDSKRREALIKMMLHKAQIFITTTDIKEELTSLESENYMKIQVEAGKIKE